MTVRELWVKLCVLCSRLRVMAAGGDGTVAWLLKTIKELQLQPPPLLAVMPLGTGNDLSLSFGWGNTFLQAWIDVSSPSKAPFNSKDSTPSVPQGGTQ